MNTLASNRKITSHACRILVLLLAFRGADAFTQNSCVPPVAGMVSWWQADSNALDSVGINNGTLHGGVSIVPGKVGNGFGFDGTGYITISNSPSLNFSNQLSIELWYKSTQSNTVYYTILDKRVGAAIANYGINNAPNNGLGVFYDDPTVDDGDDTPFGSVFEVSRYSPAPNPGVFHHLAATYEQLTNSQVQLQTFVDGQLVRTRLINGTLTNTLNSSPVTIGAAVQGAGEFFQGVIDEIAIYDRVLNAGEVQAIYDAGTNGKCATAVPPTLFGQPSSQTVAVGTNLSFTVVAGGSAPLSYQWAKNSTVLNGATSSTLTLTNVQLSDAGSYSVLVSNMLGSVTSSPAILSVVLLPPTISAQPASRSVTVGTNVSFTVIAGGSLPLIYQWEKNSAVLDGATGPTLALTNVQLSDAGSYSVVVSNVAGSITSSPAILSVFLPPASVQVMPSTAAEDGTVTVPVNLVANGNENAISFSLNFNASLLSYQSIALGSGAAEGSLFPNPMQASSGRLGVAVGLPAGQTFAAGTQQLVLVSFSSPIVTNATSTIITFGDSPIARLMANASGTAIPGNFIASNVQIPITPLEGDVYPRPNGDQALTISDWVLIGRFVAGLDSPTNASEFQRADCAPRSTLGDGALTVSDWVQAGRYIAGLDPVTRAGGPSAPVPNVVVGPALGTVAPRTQSNPRQVRLVAPGQAQGQNGTVTVALAAQGDENALAFSLSFDSAKLVYAGATMNDPAGAVTLNINARQAAQGRLGFVLALPAGRSFAAGTVSLVNVSFRAVTSASGAAAVAFADQPVARGVSDPNASTLSADYVNSSLVLNPLPSLRIVPSASQITLAWPASAAGFSLQESTDPSLAAASWATVTASPVIVNNENVVSLPATKTSKFYRLYHP